MARYVTCYRAVLFVPLIGLSEGAFFVPVCSCSCENVQLLSVIHENCFHHQMVIYQAFIPLIVVLSQHTIHNIMRTRCGMKCKKQKTNKNMHLKKCGIFQMEIKLGMLHVTVSSAKPLIYIERQDSL